MTRAAQLMHPWVLAATWLGGYISTHVGNHEKILIGARTKEPHLYVAQKKGCPEAGQAGLLGCISEIWIFPE